MAPVARIQPAPGERAPTTRQLECLGALLEAGSVAVAAAELGCAEQTVRNNLSELYARLGVDGHLAAFASLGWIRPDHARLELAADRLEAIAARLELRHP